MEDIMALAVGYFVLWSGLFSYLVYLHLQNHGLRKELALLRMNMGTGKRGH